MPFWLEYPVLTSAAVIVLTLVLLYLLRGPVHSVILTFARSLQQGLRLFARICLRSEQRVAEGNMAVSKRLTQQLVQRRLGKEFVRIEKIVKADLVTYQRLANEIKMQLAAIDEDYRASAEVPPPSPEWVSAVTAIADLQMNAKNSEVLGKILADINKTIDQHHKDALREHRWTVSNRHKLLSGLQPKWSKMMRLLSNIDSKVQGLGGRLANLDQQMARFELIVADKGGRGLLASALARFSTMLVLLLVAMVAAWASQSLLSAALAQYPIASAQLDIDLVTVASLAHIALTFAAGTLLFEAVGITQLFSMVTTVSLGLRKVVAVFAALMIIALISIEVFAVWQLSPVQLLPQNVPWPQAMLVLVGVTLPMLVALAVVPLEHVLHTTRPVIGGLVQVLLHSAVASLRLLGNLCWQVGKLATRLSDIAIFLPLWLEVRWYAHRSAKGSAAAAVATPKSRQAFDHDDHGDIVNVTPIRSYHGQRDC